MLTILFSVLEICTDAFIKNKQINHFVKLQSVQRPTAILFFSDWLGSPTGRPRRPVRTVASGYGPLTTGPTHSGPGQGQTAPKLVRVADWTNIKHLGVF